MSSIKYTHCGGLSENIESEESYTVSSNRIHTLTCRKTVEKSHSKSLLKGMVGFCTLTVEMIALRNGRFYSPPKRKHTSDPFYLRDEFDRIFTLNPIICKNLEKFFLL